MKSSRVNFLPICHVIRRASDCRRLTYRSRLERARAYKHTRDFFRTRSDREFFFFYQLHSARRANLFDGPIYFLFRMYVHTQAQAALMHDAVLVLVETFNKLLWKKPEMFKTNTKRTLSNGNTSMSVPSSQSLGLDCNSGRTSGNQWEHGEKISRFLRKVRLIRCEINCERGIDGVGYSVILMSVRSEEKLSVIG